MAKRNRLEKANINYGSRCLKVYDSCKNRRTPVAVGDLLLESVTRAGGIVENIITCGDDGGLAREALTEINKARYLAKLLYDNGLCSDRCVRRFMVTADELTDAIINPNPTKKRRRRRKARLIKKRRKQESVVIDYDPDGFDDPVEVTSSDAN